MNIDKLSYIKMLENLVRDYDPDYSSTTNWELQAQIADEINAVIQKIGGKEGHKLYEYFLKERNK
tara:strand:+ start:325 stop:519 length:195 start_codon:yes stop_codon:yes gene_type:complete